MIYAFSLHALLSRQGQLLLLRLQNQKKPKAVCNILQRSLQSLPPTYNNIEPNVPKSKAPKKEMRNSLKVNSPFTTGCKNAKTTKAIAKFINPLPSSLATFLSFIKTIIAKSVFTPSNEKNSFSEHWYTITIQGNV